MKLEAILFVTVSVLAILGAVIAINKCEQRLRQAGEADSETQRRPLAPNARPEIRYDPIGIEKFVKPYDARPEIDLGSGIKLKL